MKSTHIKLLPLIGRRFFFVLCLLGNGVAFSATTSTADHSKFEALQVPFENIKEVNQACVSCHNMAESQLHKTIHWQWDYPLEGEDSAGKLNVINGYHPNVVSNIDTCDSCHIGFGLAKNTTDFIPEAAVDCLACHDTSGEYFYNRFHQSGAECAMCHDDGAEAEKARVKKEGERFTLSLTEMAQRAGETSVQTCGSCHFYDGGGDGAKHGDLDSALISASFEMDVHMSKDGAGLTCSSCHQSNDHQLFGSRYDASLPENNTGISALDGAQATCESCHGDRPMHDEKLNDHTDVVACQTCHIPSYARNGIATKTHWDWSTAGELDRKKRPDAKYDDEGRVIYSSFKGDLQYGSDLTPVYRWYDGALSYTQVGALATEGETELTKTTVSAGDENAKIAPFHEFKSLLPIDSESRQLMPMYLAGSSRDAYWNGFDWKKSLSKGAKAADLDFSGDYEFALTSMLWSLNHTVAPKEQALTCADCHSKGGVLAEVTDVYIPGRAQHTLLDKMGLLALIAAVLGVLTHGALRWVFNRRRSRS